MNDEIQSEAEALRKLSTRDCWSGGDPPKDIPYHGEAGVAPDAVRALLAAGKLEISISGVSGCYMPWSALTERERDWCAHSASGHWGWWVRLSEAGRAALAEAAKRPPATNQNSSESDRALALCRWAVEQTGDENLTDDAAYDFVRDHLRGEALQKRDTWKRYLGRARADHDARKEPNKRRHFPPRSAVRLEQTERRDGD